MEDFVTLVKQGVIYDGCPIVAKGTVRILGNDICIESMHELMAVDGKNFGALCEPGRTEQGQFIDKDLQVDTWKSKAEELEKEKELLSAGMNKLQGKLQQEYTLRTAIEQHLEREKLVSANAAEVIHTANSKLTSKAEELDQLQRQLAAKDDLIQELQSQLDSAHELLLEREQKMEALIKEKDASATIMEIKTGQAESLRSRLDSASIILGEKEEKLQNLQNALGEKDATVKETELKERDALLIAQGLKDRVDLLEAERIEGKRKSNDFSQWRYTAEEEIENLRKELENSKVTITSLKNELEVADLEESQFSATITALQKENDALRSQLQLAAKPAGGAPSKRRVFKQDFMSNMSFAF